MWSNQRTNKVGQGMYQLPIRIRTTNILLGTTPGNPDLYEEFILSKAPDDVDTKAEYAQTTEFSVEDEMSKGITVFPRGKFIVTEDGRYYDPIYDVVPDDVEGKEVVMPFMWDYQWRGAFKEAISMLSRAAGGRKKKAAAVKEEEPAATEPAAEEKPKKRGRKSKAEKEAEEAAAKATKEGTVAEKKKDAIMASIAPRNFAAAKITAHKKVVDGGWFIKQRRIPLFFPDTFIDDVGVEHETVQGVLPDGNMKLPIYTRPLRIDTAPYPRVALAASEYLPSGTEAYFTICLMNPADKEAMLECLDFKEYVGMLQWRGGGKGTLVWTPATKDGVPVDDIP